MSNHPSARNLVDAAKNKKPSPAAQAVLDAMDGLPTAENSPETSPSNRKSKLLQRIDEKLAEGKKAKAERSARKGKASQRACAAKVKSNRLNSQLSTGPKSEAGKARVSANALKTGFFANVERLNPQDSAAYQNAVADLRMGLHPDGPVEEQLIRELAMFRARLLRLEAAEYALLCSGIETGPERTDEFVVRDQELDAREIAAAYVNNAAALEHLHKAEIHLRRAYNRTWDRLERMQKERHKLPLDQALKQSQRWLTYEAERTNQLRSATGQPPVSTITAPPNILSPKPETQPPAKPQSNGHLSPQPDAQTSAKGLSADTASQFKPR